MGARGAAVMALLVFACLSVQASARPGPNEAIGRRLLATPPSKGLPITAPTIKFNGTHIQLPFAPPGFNGSIVCPKNGSHPPGPPRPSASMLRGDAIGAMPPHPQDAARALGAARPATPPGSPAMPMPGSEGRRGGPEGRHGLPMPALVNVTGALNASLPILAYNGTGPMPHPCPMSDGPNGPHAGPDDRRINGPGPLLNAPPGTPAVNPMDGPAGGGGPSGVDGPTGSGLGGVGGGPADIANGMGGGPGGMAGGGPQR